MKPTAIVYTSNTGHTARYAAMLAEATGLPAFRLEESALPKGAPVIYMGWLFALNLKGYAKAAGRYRVVSAVGVGLCPTGELLAEVRKTAKIPENVPFFTLQGGMDHGKLRGVNKFMISMLVKMLAGKKDKTPEETEMLRMIRAGGDFVCEENLAAVLNWWKEIQ